MKLFATYGDDLLFINTNVTYASQVRSMMRKAAKRFGRLDFAVNNAGVYDWRDYSRMEGIRMRPDDGCESEGRLCVEKP